jgi:hypothetical protein
MALAKNPDGTPREPTLTERTKRSRELERSRSVKPDFWSSAQGLDLDKEAWTAMSVDQRARFAAEMIEFLDDQKLGLLGERSGDFTILETGPRPALWLAEERTRYETRPWMTFLATTFRDAIPPEPEGIDLSKESMEVKSALVKREFQMTRARALKRAATAEAKAPVDQTDVKQATKLSPQGLAQILTGVADTAAQAGRPGTDYQK